MKRRELFGSLVSKVKDSANLDKKRAIIRPPYCTDELLFDNCIDCDGKCALVCEEEIIKISKDKIPYLDFSKSGCTYCDECAVVCEFDVLKIENKKNIAVNISINKDKCISWDGVMCFSCKEPCLEDAINFRAMFMPELDQSKCTSCGFCIARCPTYAIDIKG